MKFLFRTLTTAVVLACASTTQAGPADTLMDRVDKLHQLQVKKFTGVKPAEVKALRQDFRTALQAAQSQAKAEFARLSAGKTPEQVDKVLRAAAAKAGTPPDVQQAVEAMGGPYKTMQQSDRILQDFATDVLADSQAFAQWSAVERALLAALGVGDAHAGIRRGGCTLVIWAVTWGSSPDTAYKLCNRYS